MCSLGIARWRDALAAKREKEAQREDDDDIPPPPPPLIDRITVSQNAFLCRPELCEPLDLPAARSSSQKACSSMSALTDSRVYDEMTETKQDWLRELSTATENECQSILYAKSLYELSGPSVSASLKSAPTVVDVRSTPLSASLSNLSSAPPAKPQRCFARLTSSTGSRQTAASSTASSTLILNASSTPSQPSFSPRPSGPSSEASQPSLSTQDLLELCRSAMDERYVPRTCSMRKGHSHTALETIGESSSARNFRPQVSSFHVNESLTRVLQSPLRERATPCPPPYDQLRIRVDRTGSSRLASKPSNGTSSRRPPLHALRHTIAVNQEDVEAAQNMTASAEGRRPPSRQEHPSTVESAALPFAFTASPKSDSSASNSSVDSGQCSGSPPLGLKTRRMTEVAGASSLHSFSSSREEKDNSETDSVFAAYQKRCLPGYARMASTMDHVLRTASALYALLGASPSASVARDLLSKSIVFIQIVETSPCDEDLQDIKVVRLQMKELQREASATGKPLLITNYFTIVLRKMVEQVLQVFAKVPLRVLEDKFQIISRYLAECVNKDRLLAIALEHLIHLVLFGDELCLETIQCGGLNSIVKLCRQSSTPTETLRLLLRALAVLCGVSKGCLQLLAV